MRQFLPVSSVPIFSVRISSVSVTGTMPIVAIPSRPRTPFCFGTAVGICSSGIDHTQKGRAMKKILLIAFMIMAVLPLLWAQGNRGIIKIRLSDNDPIMVRIDQRYYDEEARLLTVGNVTPGRHRVRVYLADKRGFQRRNLVYDGYLNIQAGMSHYFVIDRRKGSVRTTTSRIDDRRERDRDERYEQEPADRRRYRDEITRGGGSNWTLQDMRDLKERVDDRITDSDKLKLMKSVLANKRYSTAQTTDMLGWLSFESSKLDFAKWSYDNITDRGNYWKVEEVFWFGSSKEEFRQFLEGR